MFPMSLRYFEDLSIGETRELAGKTVTKSEIIEFAQKYDPQPFHLDERAAEGSVFGGIVAPGWMTVCILNRLIVDGFIRETANMGGRGADDVRWHRPLRPETTVTGIIEVLSKTPSDRHSDRGYVTYEFCALNDKDEKLLSMTAELLVRRRETAG